MALTAITVAVLIIIVISLGRERHGIAFTHRGAAAELELSVQKSRHCERSETIQSRIHSAAAVDCFVPRNDDELALTR